MIEHSKKNVSIQVGAVTHTVERLRCENVFHAFLVSRATKQRSRGDTRVCRTRMELKCRDDNE